MMTDPHVSGMFSLGDPHHPQELVDVVARVSDHPSEDDQHIVYVQQPHDVIRHALIGRHGFAHLREPIRERQSDFLRSSISSCGWRGSHQCDVAVVPGVVVH